MLPFEYDKNLPFNLEVQKSEDYDIISFDAPYEPVIKESKRVYLYLFKAKNPIGNLIFLHGIGNNNIRYLMWFTKEFSKKGFNSYFLILPYHLRRAPKEWKGGELFFCSSPNLCVVRFHHCIMDVMRTIDYIEKNSNLPVYIMGYSFGGMISVISLALDKRIKKGIIAFAGADWRWINWYSPYTESIRYEYATKGNEYNCRSERDCIINRGNTEKIVSSFRNINDIFKFPLKCYHYDPISFAPFVDQEVLVFRALFDKIMPQKSYSQLLKFLKNKKVVAIPSGHKSSYFFRKIISNSVISFLKNSLKNRRGIDL